MKKHKGKIGLILGIVLIAAGLIIISLPTLNSSQIKKQSENLVEEVIEMDKEVIEQNQLEEGEFNYEAINNISATRTLLNRPNYNRQQIIGQFLYPRLEMNLSLFNTLSDGNLLAGVTTMKPNQVMGENNYTIAGHYVDTKDVLLNQLLNSQLGDIIRITNMDTIYEYTVVDMKKVEASALYMLEDSQVSNYNGDPLLSVMSCYYYDTDYRWFVIGELTRTFPYSKERMMNG